MMYLFIIKYKYKYKKSKVKKVKGMKDIIDSLDSMPISIKIDKRRRSKSVNWDINKSYYYDYVNIQTSNFDKDLLDSINKYNKKCLEHDMKDLL